VGTEESDDHARVDEDEGIGYDDERRAWSLASRSSFTLFLVACKVVA
jgi:hypothetical protein